VGGLENRVFYRSPPAQSRLSDRHDWSRIARPIDDDVTHGMMHKECNVESEKLNMAPGYFY